MGDSVLHRHPTLCALHSPFPPSPVASAAAPPPTTCNQTPTISWVINPVPRPTWRIPVATPSAICPAAPQIIWKASSVFARQSGRRAAIPSAGPKPDIHAHLEPYMGMMSHAAVLRSDGRVFAHLHPLGNYSMAAQTLFETRMAKETGVAGGSGPDHSKTDEWCGHTLCLSGGASRHFLALRISVRGGLPPIWVQIKTDGQIMTSKV